ncbi:DUF1796 family putative cysteine peptidase [Paenibacillus marinisediminis]
MRLADLKGDYDGIFSLGDLCLASIQLQKNNLRPYSGVLDWMGSPQLSDVNRLLMNRFEGFMELQNLRVVGDATEEMLLVSDDVYHILSNHDFSKKQNTYTHLDTYPEVKQKFERRIDRFLEKANSCKRILFVRTEGNFQDAYDLQMVLSGLVQHDFAILLVNHAPVGEIYELNWPLDKVCAIQLPNQEKWEGNNHLWKILLDGIRHI